MLGEQRREQVLAIAAEVDGRVEEFAGIDTDAGHIAGVKQGGQDDEVIPVPDDEGAPSVAAVRNNPACGSGRRCVFTWSSPVLHPGRGCVHVRWL